MPDYDSQSWWRRPSRFLPVVLVPAFFAGLFSLIPNLFERFIAPEARLEFSVVGSPAIDINNRFNSIYSLKIYNKGSLKLSNISANLIVPNGSVQKSSLTALGGAGKHIEKTLDGANLIVGSMFPNETVSATLLISSNRVGTRPMISVRSDQVLGKPAEDEPDLKQSVVPIWFSIFPAVGVMLSSIAGVVILRSQMLQGRLSLNRDDVVGMISTYFDDPQFDAAFVIAQSDITYARFSELIGRKGRNGPQNVTDKAVKALMSLYLSPMMAETSRQIVWDNLVGIDPTADASIKSELEKKTTKIKNMADFRRVVAEIFT